MLNFPQQTHERTERERKRGNSACPALLVPSLARPRLPCVGICARTYLCSALAACAPWPRYFPRLAVYQLVQWNFPLDKRKRGKCFACLFHLLPSFTSFLATFCMCACVEARRRRRRMQRVAATPTLAVPAAQRRGETSDQCAVNCFMAAAASSCSGSGSAASVGICHIYLSPAGQLLRNDNTHYQLYSILSLCFSYSHTLCLTLAYTVPLSPVLSLSIFF